MKERKQIHIIELRENIQLSFNHLNDSIELQNSDGEPSLKTLISVANAYERKGKTPKILRQFKNPTGSTIHFKISPTISYDRFFAIDTSYKTFGENLLCTTSCILLDQKFDLQAGLKKGDIIEYIIMPRLLFISRLGTKPERFGWMNMIDAFCRSEFYKSEWNFCAIVDSDLNDIQKINAKEQPILDNYLLPENLTLTYASADVGQEIFINRIIKLTDKIANETLNSVIKRIPNIPEILKSKPPIELDHFTLAIIDDDKYSIPRF